MSRKPDILKAATELFAAKGYHATSTHEIAERAGLSEGIIFYYFKTKEQIMLGILEDVFEAYLMGIDEVMEQTDSGWEAIKAYIKFHFAMGEERATEIICLSRDFPAAIIDTSSPHREGVHSYFHKLLKLVSGALERGQQDGSVRPCPVLETAFLVISTLASLPKFDIIGVSPGTSLLEPTLEFMRRALCPPSKPVS